MVLHNIELELKLIKRLLRYHKFKDDLSLIQKKKNQSRLLLQHPWVSYSIP